MVQSRMFLVLALAAVASATTIRTDQVDQGALWGFIEKTVEKHHNTHFKGLQSFGIEREVTEYMPLDDWELREIEEVREAFKTMDEVLFDATQTESFKKDKHTQETVMVMMNVAIERIVKCLQRIGRFQKISREGQMYLLKKTMMNLLTIRGIVRLDEQSRAWNTPIIGEKTQVSLDMFDHINCPVQKERFLAFAKVIDVTLRKDQTAMELISLLALFDEPITGKDYRVVHFNYHLYDYLLGRYVESVYGERSTELLKTVKPALARLVELTKTSYELFGRRQIFDY